MTIHETLGIRPVINASATLTKLGGSLMPPSVMAAMGEAATEFVDLHELQEKTSARIAKLTRNDACHISSGAAAGITLTVAACVAGTDSELQQAFPYLDGVEKSEVVVFGGQRNGYDYAARQTGVRLIEVGPSEDELTSALSKRTACVLYFAGANFADAGLPLDEVVPIAHDRSIPVIVDAAAQIPPVSNLWHYTTDVGADAAIFSGGKGLRGPQVSGLILGKLKIIEGCRVNGAPNHSLGRPMKCGKEEMAGILAAVEWSLAQDESALLEQYEATVQMWIDGLAGLAGVSAERRFPSEAGQPHGRTFVTFDRSAGLDRDQIVRELWERNPRIAVAEEGVSDIALNPQTLEPGQEVLVLNALREAVEASRNQSGKEPT